MSEKQIRTISILDPAIDWIATPSENVKRFVNDDREAFEDRGDKPALLAFRANMTPAVYTLRVIPHEVATGYIAERPTDESRYLAAFRAALVKVEHGYDAAGRPLIASWQPLACREAKRSLARVASLLTDDELEQFEGPTVQEIGALAWSRYAFFHRGTVLSWLLPLSVQQTWATVRSRFPAAQDASTAMDGQTRTEPAPQHADLSTPTESPAAA